MDGRTDGRHWLILNLSTHVTPAAPSLLCLFLKGCWEISKRMLHVWSQLRQKINKEIIEKMREANSKSLHIYWRGSRGANPRETKTKTGFKTKHKCGEVAGEGPIWGSTQRSKVSLSVEQKWGETGVKATEEHCIQKRKYIVWFNMEATCLHDAAVKK